MGLISFVKDAGEKLIDRVTGRDKEEESREIASHLTKVVNTMGEPLPGVELTLHFGQRWMGPIGLSERERRKIRRQRAIAARQRQVS